MRAKMSYDPLPGTVARDIEMWHTTPNAMACTSTRTASYGRYRDDHNLVVIIRREIDHTQPVRRVKLRIYPISDLTKIDHAGWGKLARQKLGRCTQP